mgnify:CR=1 FL=1
METKMSYHVTVDMASAVPPFEQVRSQIAALITSGTLTSGQRLPTVRDLAADLGIAVGTVARAYRELERLGLVTSRRRLGTVVSTTKQLDTQTVQATVEDLVRTARAAGMTDEDVLGLVQGTLLATPDNNEEPQEK